MKHGVYQIRNLTNGKRYIGSASSSGGFRIRWNSHKSELQNGTHHSRYLQRVWNKHGPDVFVFEILEECEPSQCVEREQYYLDTLLFASCNDGRFYQLGYNSCRIAGSCLGTKHSKETKQRMSQAQMGREVSYDTRAKIRKALLGRRVSCETRIKMAQAGLGRQWSAESRERVAQASRGRLHSQETKNKIAQANRGINSPSAKLADDLVRNIKTLLRDGISQRKIAQQFQVGQMTISDIKRGITWSHIS